MTAPTINPIEQMPRNDAFASAFNVGSNALRVLKQRAYQYLLFNQRLFRGGKTYSGRTMAVHSVGIRNTREHHHSEGNIHSGAESGTVDHSCMTAAE